MQTLKVRSGGRVLLVVERTFLVELRVFQLREMIDGGHHRRGRVRARLTAHDQFLLRRDNEACGVRGRCIVNNDVGSGHVWLVFSILLRRILGE